MLYTAYHEGDKVICCVHRRDPEDFIILNYRTSWKIGVNQLLEYDITGNEALEYLGTYGFYVWKNNLVGLRPLITIYLGGE